MKRIEGSCLINETMYTGLNIIHHITFKYEEKVLLTVSLTERHEKVAMNFSS